MNDSLKKIIISFFLQSKILISDLILNYKQKIKVCFYCTVVFYVIYKNSDIFFNSECFIDMPLDTSKIFREPENCDFCRNVTKINKVSKINPYDFYNQYTKLLKPVVVTDGLKNWPASEAFTFNFFKNLYQNLKFNNNINRRCQFFPYQTEFKKLTEVFEMPEARAKLDPGEKPWYVGWNNCNDDAGKILRQYYSKPYFFGNHSENIAMSWIFMGGPGYGAQMHIDNVHYPSWQAQVTGRKLWKLAPPPECWNVCNPMEIEVKKGEIIVVDTNRWYHQTIVLPGEISITIGSEYD